MIAVALRTDIERYAARMRFDNPLVSRAERGTLGPEHLARYLENIRVLVSHTPVHLMRAIERCRANGQSSLARHFGKKLGEEEGHDQWAERDAQRVAAMIGQVAPRQRAAALDELLTFIEATIDRDPTLYLAYISFAEYLIVLMGPEWLKVLDERCGIPASSMTVIGNHAELDAEHSEEAFDAIDELVVDPRKLNAMRATLQQTIRLFDRFSSEVVALGDQAHYAASVRSPAA
jgi:hypothetical protein